MNDFLETADMIGTQLLRDAIHEGPRCNWTGDAMEHIGGRWQVAHRACGPDLYGGTAGIALFLARLHAATGERLHARVARAALAQAASRADDVPAMARHGFYAGTLGIAWTLLTAGRLLDDQPALQAGATLLDRLAGESLDDQGIDITSGSAGAVLAWLDLARLDLLSAAERDRARAMARRHGERLLAKAQRSQRGLGWPDATSATGLCGFSHGASGIATALLALHADGADDRMLAAARGALAYERSWFDAEAGNWPDLRSDPTLPPPINGRHACMSAWCHGAPGIGLARLVAHDVTGDSLLADEAATALRTTAATLQSALNGAPCNFSLCHGLAGNADLLIEAAHRRGDAEALALARDVGRLGQTLFARTETPWPCGVAGGGENPSLLLGIAGIGNFYLRLHDPATPSVLLGAWSNVSR